MRHTAPTVAALKTFSISNPLDSVIPARRESIRDAERTESAKTGASTAQFGSCGGPDLTGRLVGNPTNAPHATLPEAEPDLLATDRVAEIIKGDHPALGVQGTMLSVR